MTGDTTPPKATAGDTLHLLARAGLQMVPVVGGPAAEFFAALVQPPLARRQRAWCEAIGEALSRLESERRVPLDDLADDPIFIDAVMHASQAALRTSQEEKLTALRNAVINAALPGRPEAALQAMFISWIGEFTEWHVRLLRLFDDPGAWFRDHQKAIPNLSTGALSDVLEAAYPELTGRRDFYDQVWRELNARGLVSTDGLHTGMTGSGLSASRTSELGKQFMSFVRAPA
jgi:hypothetical protein